MYDGYTFNSIPLRNMTDEDIKDCLVDGIEIIDTDDIQDMSLDEARKAITQRLEIELTIRHLRKGNL